MSQEGDLQRIVAIFVKIMAAIILPCGHGLIKVSPTGAHTMFAFSSTKSGSHSAVAAVRESWICRSFRNTRLEPWRLRDPDVRWQACGDLISTHSRKTRRKSSEYTQACSKIVYSLRASCVETHSRLYQRSSTSLEKLEQNSILSWFPVQVNNILADNLPPFSQAKTLNAHFHLCSQHIETCSQHIETGFTCSIWAVTIMQTPCIYTVTFLGGG
jgi:hypothetical protein